MEKALSVAQTTIQKLEAELDREKFKSSQLENEWDALSLNAILVSRQEYLVERVKSMARLI